MRNQNRLSVVLASSVLVGIAALTLAFWLRISEWGEHRDEDRAGAYLRSEFHLTDAQARQIDQIEDTYRPGWQQLSARLEASEDKLAALIEANRVVTPEVAAALKEFENLRAEAQLSMLAHVYEVSRVMSPAQAKRYISWMRKRITESPDALEPPDERD